MTGVKRLTPLVPGAIAPFLWLDGTVKTGFVSGRATEGHGFPQWAMVIFSEGDKTHYFGDVINAEAMSACGRVLKNVAYLFLPGNYPRCKACEKKFTAELRKRGAA